MNHKHHIGSDGHQYLMLDLPDDAWGIELNGNRNRLIYDTIQEYDSIEKRLPSGNWQILGREKELDNDQAGEIAGILPCLDGNKDGAKSTLSSLTTSLGIDNPLILKNLDK